MTTDTEVLLCSVCLAVASKMGRKMTVCPNPTCRADLTRPGATESAEVA